MTQTRAAVVNEPSAAFELVALSLDDPRPDEVRVRLVGSGVCHTDAIVRDQVYPVPLPAVLGHEGAGVVEAVGPEVRGVAVGDHVVLSVNSCGWCANCVGGAVTYCADSFARNFGGRRADGTSALSRDGEPISSHFFGQSSFAELANVAARSVVPVDRDVPLELLGPLGCGIQTGAGAVINSLAPPAGASFAVFGSGAVGLSALMAAQLVGCDQIIAVDLHGSRLALARELGASDTVDATAGDVPEQIRELTAGAGVDYALETTGLPTVLREAVDSIALRGTVGLVGAAAFGTETALDTGLGLTRGWTLRMIIEGDAVPQVFIPGLLRLWQRDRFPFDRLITRYPFAAINEAFADSAAGTTIKPVLVMAD